MPAERTKNPFWLLLAFYVCLTLNAVIGAGLVLTWGMAMKQFSNPRSDEWFKFFSMALVLSCFVDVVAYWLLIKRRMLGLHLKLASAITLVLIMLFMIGTANNYHANTIALALSPLAWPIVIALFIRKEPVK